MKTLADIAEFLHAEFGFDESHPGEATLRRIVAGRCEALEVSGTADYAALLRRSAEEREALLEAVIVSETYFFRHPASFRALVAWVKERNRFPVRILSAACATGEEAYSLAMALRDAGLAPGDFVVEGCDVSAASLVVARRAIYTSKAFRSTELEWRDRYFTRVDDGWQATDALRRLVQFREGNLFTLEGEGSWDAVFCRNVMIYFSPARQEQIIALLDRILARDGMLFLGPAEPPLFLSRGWQSGGLPMSFSCVRGRPTPAAPREVASPVQKRIVEPAKAKRTISVTSAPHDRVDRLEAARTLADSGRLDAAESLLSDISVEEPGNSEVHFLSGIVAEARGFDEQAEAFYRKTLYAAPGHTGALEHMELLLRRHGRMQAADILHRRAARHAFPS